MTVRILQGDALSMLKTLDAGSVQVCVTSPPYFQLRAYQTEPKVWGGDPEHTHVWDERRYYVEGGGGAIKSGEAFSEPGPENAERIKAARWRDDAICPCGAWRGELGLEPTPQAFIEHLLTIFDEVRRVLRDDGVLFVNIGDSRSGSGKGPTGANGIGDQRRRQGFIPGEGGDQDGARNRDGVGRIEGVPAKSLLLIPQRFAIGMADRGWIVRDQIVWAKKSCMPESVKDRCTSAWEPIFMFTKRGKYYWDAEAVRQPLQESSLERGYTYVGRPETGAKALAAPADVRAKADWRVNGYVPAGANLRNVWHLGPEPSREEHYASYPTELVRRCVLAATSEKGQCPACGAPWRRVVERVNPRMSDEYQRRPNQPKQEAGIGVHYNLGGKRHGLSKPGWRENEPSTATTLGWEAGCSCEAGPPRPQTVLDPFLGSGTTALVADRLGRDAIGIELSPKYAEMARRRIASDAPMFAEIEVTA